MTLRTLFLLLAALALAATSALGAKSTKEKPVVIEGESCEQNMACSWTALNVSRTAEATASSVLENKKDYAARNVIDADPLSEDGYFFSNPATAWCEGKKDTGQGEYISITFKEPVQVYALLISAGYDKNPDIFSKNSRIKKATLKLSDGSRYELRFGEHFFDMNNGKESYQPLKTISTITNSPQLFVLTPGGAKSRTISWMTLIIDETVPGWKYKDTCISTIDIIPRPEE